MLDVAVARRLKLVGFDVDGVLTDNGVYIGMVGDHPVEFKRFHIQDGLGVRMLRTAGLAVVWLSGGNRPPRRCARASPRWTRSSRIPRRASFRRSQRCSSGAGSAG